MLDNPLELESEIARIKLRKGKLQKESKKLGLETGLSLERVARLQERRHALAMEAKERGDEYKKLSRDLQEKLTKEQKNRKLFIPEDLACPTPDTEEKEKVKEKFMGLLDRKINTVANQHLKKYLTEAYDLKNEDPNIVNEDDAYSKSHRVWSVLVVLEEEAENPINNDEKHDHNHTEDGRDALIEENEKDLYFTTFRIGQNTSFAQLKEEAAKFWDKNPQHYDFYDEKGEIINAGRSQKIERYFKFRLQDLNQLVIVMKLNERIKEMRSLNTCAMHKLDMSERPKKQLDDYEKYQKHFPKLQKYMKLNKEEITEREARLKKMNNPRGCGESNICIVLLLALMLVEISYNSFPYFLKKAFTVVAILQNRETKIIRLQNLDFRRLMNLDRFATINRLNDYLDFLIEDIVNVFPIDINPDPSNTEYYERVFRLYRPIVFRQYRVRENPVCPASLKQLNYSCYYSEYSSSTMNTEPFGEYEFENIMLPHHLKGKVDGLYGKYTPSAYNIVLDPAVTNASQFVTEVCSLFITTLTAKQHCQSIINTLCNGTCPGLVARLDEEFGPNSTKTSFIDSSTRAISFEVVMMDRSHNDLFYLQPRLEFAPSGNPIPASGRIIRFKPSLKGDADLPISESFIQGFTITLAVLLLLFIIYNLFVGGNGKLNLKYFCTLQGLLNVIIIALVFYAQYLLDTLSSFEADMISVNDISAYPTTQDIAETYERIGLVRGCLVGFLILRLTLTLELNAKFKMITSTYETGIIYAIPLLIIFFAVLFALCGTAYFTYGSVDIEFNNYRQSISTMILIAVGFQDGWLKELTFGRGFFICLCVYVLYFLMMGVLAAVFVETYRRVSLDHGFDYRKKYSWRFHDYIDWVFSWVPRKLKMKKSQVKKLKSKLNNIRFKKIEMPSWLKRKEKKNENRQEEEIQFSTK